jgi:hypothetical protein
VNEAPKRRWLRFSLRALFVFVTVLACWLGYEVNWIRHRRELDAKHRALASEFIDRLAMRSSGKLILDLHEPAWLTRFQLWLFRENPRHTLTLIFIVEDDGTSLSGGQLAEVELAKRLFPEAVIDWDVLRSDASIQREETLDRMQTELRRLDPLGFPERAVSK